MKVPARARVLLLLVLLLGTACYSYADGIAATGTYTATQVSPGVFQYGLAGKGYGNHDNRHILVFLDPRSGSPPLVGPGFEFVLTAAPATVATPLPATFTSNNRGVARRESENPSRLPVIVKGVVK